MKRILDEDEYRKLAQGETKAYALSVKINSVCDLMSIQKKGSHPHDFDEYELCAEERLDSLVALLKSKFTHLSFKNVRYDIDFTNATVQPIKTEIQIKERVITEPCSLGLRMKIFAFGGIAGSLVILLLLSFMGVFANGG